jgi:hypothetical protein
MEDTAIRDGVHSGETSQGPLQVSDRPDVVEAVKPVIALSAEQQAVLQKVKEGRSIFFTGSAGTISRSFPDIPSVTLSTQ